MKEGREQSLRVVGLKIRVEGNEKWGLDKKGSQKRLQKWHYSVCTWRKPYCHWCRADLEREESGLRVPGASPTLFLGLFSRGARTEHLLKTDQSSVKQTQ